MLQTGAGQAWTGSAPRMNGQTVSSVERRFGGASATPSSGCCCSLAPPSLSPAMAAPAPRALAAAGSKRLQLQAQVP